MIGITKAAFARELGVSPSYVTALSKAGRLVLTPDGLVDAAASKQRIQATAGAPERMSNQAPAFADYAEKSKYYEAEGRRLDYEERIRTLYQTSEVNSIVANAITTLRTRLELLPDQLSPQLAAQHDENEIRAALANEIEAMLGDLSAQLASLAGGAA